MEDWNAQFGGRKFITDLGDALQDRPDRPGRYALWVPQGKGHQIVEVSDDLEDLCRRHQVSAQYVCHFVRGVMA